MTIRRRTLLGAAAASAALGTAPRAGRAQVSGEPVAIGVPMPLTGLFAATGQAILAGIRLAAEEANKSGGLLGRPIKLLVEDTKGEPNAAATVGASMAADKSFFAFVGGYGSTADFALLQGARRYKPIFIHVSSSSVHLENAFGKEPWYFHIYIWDYHRAKTATRFLQAMAPRPQVIAMAHEDGLYGSDAAKYAEKYFVPAGFHLAMNEPFRSGSADFSPILNRVKALAPDVFYFVGYVPDEIQLQRQAHELGIRPKLTLIVGSTQKRSDFGAAGEGLCIIREWATAQTTPGNAAWVQKAEAALGPGAPGSMGFFQGYSGMMTLVDAVRAAKALDRDAVLEKLSTMKFDTPYGHIGYAKSEGGALHQLCSDDTMLVTQYHGDAEDVVWPQDKANSTLVYPLT